LQISLKKNFQQIATTVESQDSRHSSILIILIILIILVCVIWLLLGCCLVVIWLLICLFIFKLFISVSALTAYTYGGLFGVDMGVDISVLSGCYLVVDMPAYLQTIYFGKCPNYIHLRRFIWC